MIEIAGGIILGVLALWALLVTFSFVLNVITYILARRKYKL